MIDTQEPKNGDFARYVENLSRLPPGQGQVIGPRAPGSQSDEDAQPRREQMKALRKALEERKQRLSFQVVRENRADELRGFLEREVWSVILSLIHI